MRRKKKRNVPDRLGGIYFYQNLHDNPLEAHHSLRM